MYIFETVHAKNSKYLLQKNVLLLTKLSEAIKLNALNGIITDFVNEKHLKSCLMQSDKLEARKIAQIKSVER